jgi:hypothetical protein
MLDNNHISIVDVLTVSGAREGASHGIAIPVLLSLLLIGEHSACIYQIKKSIQAASFKK